MKKKGWTKAFGKNLGLVFDIVRSERLIADRVAKLEKSGFYVEKHIVPNSVFKLFMIHEINGLYYMQVSTTKNIPYKDVPDNFSGVAYMVRL